MSQLENAEKYLLVGNNNNTLSGVLHRVSSSFRSSCVSHFRKLVSAFLVLWFHASSSGHFYLFGFNKKLIQKKLDDEFFQQQTKLYQMKMAPAILRDVN